MYLLYESENGTLWDHFFLFYIYWTFTSTIIFPVFIGLFFLTFFHFCSGASSVTTLENMSGVPLKI